MSLISTAQIAKLVGVTPRRLLAIAKDRGVRPKGTLGRNRLWSPAQASQLQQGAKGWRKPRSGGTAAKKQMSKRRPLPARTQTTATVAPAKSWAWSG